MTSAGGARDRRNVRGSARFREAFGHVSPHAAARDELAALGERLMGPGLRRDRVRLEWLSEGRLR